MRIAPGNGLVEVSSAMNKRMLPSNAFLSIDHLLDATCVKKPGRFGQIGPLDEPIWADVQVFAVPSLVSCSRSRHLTFVRIAINA